MAPSEDFASGEPWLFRTDDVDLWLSEAYARDTEAMTEVLQKSMSDSTNTSNNSGTLTSDSMSQFFGGVVKPEVATAASNVSGSETETAPKRQRSAVPVSGPGRKATKRKSRASKRSQTTFITADPENFRQMVQQVTGVKFSSSEMAMVPVLKPEPKRPSGWLVGAGSCLLPTLDTSAFLLDRNQQPVAVGPTAGIGPLTGSGQLFYGPSMGLCDGGDTAGLEFDTFPSFPTLDSWKVV